jgi:hypothetical protein
MDPVLIRYAFITRHLLPTEHFTNQTDLARDMNEAQDSGVPVLQHDVHLPAHDEPPPHSPLGTEAHLCPTIGCAMHPPVQTPIQFEDSHLDQQAPFWPDSPPAQRATSPVNVSATCSWSNGIISL